ncbi:hypothetical protein OO012_14380 [Rhodobacteraceae bacterium KMM 6894]|nr:hypothetical protein [Rhodobacteraceae bacterium KMM 6894]
MAINSTPTIIDLSELDVPGSGRLLQKNAFQKLQGFVDDRLSAIREIGTQKVELSELSYDRFHQAILIEGGRGSGKTTFLIKALKDVQDGDETGSRVRVLQVIDPTLIETKDHIILVILQMIDAAVEETHSDYHEQQKLDHARAALADGLSLLDGIGPRDLSGNEWEDSNWVMSEGLRKAKNGRLFEQNLNAYINCALEVLKRDAFILAFDDVDTNFQRGHTILETIRKYLTSPRLILLLSGDLDLYGRLVRQNIYKTFGSEVMQFDAEMSEAGRHSLSDAVLELEEQYLLKVLPPQYRIPMLPLGALLENTIMVRPSKEANEQELAKWSSDKIRLQLREEKSTPDHPFLNVVFSQHLRLVFGYLRALMLVDKNPSESRAKVLQVFSNRLRSAGMEGLLLQHGIFDQNLRTVFDWIAKSDEPSALVTFRNPGTADEALILHCTALVLADGLKDGGAVMRALFALGLPAAMTKRTELSGPEKHKAILEFLWRRGELFLPDLAARITSISRTHELRGRLRASVFGSVGLAQKGSFTKAQPGISRIYGIPIQDDIRTLKFDALETLVKESKASSAPPKWLEILKKYNQTDIVARQNVSWFTIDALLSEERSGAFGPVLDLISFRRFNSNGEILQFVSSLSIFAAISELLATEAITKDDLIRLSIHDVVPLFGDSGIGNDDSASDSSEIYEESTDDGGDQELSSAEDDDTYNDFIGALNEWLAFAKSLKETTALSPSLIGTLANRLNDDLRDLDDNRNTPNFAATGQILHRQITAFLNAVITVTAGHTGRRETTKTSDVVLKRALRRSQTEMLHPLAAVLLSCPLVWSFLNPAEDDETGDDSKDSLRTAVLNALELWSKTSATDKTSNKKPDFEKWTTAPKIHLKIGKIGSASNTRFVEIDGFYDLLNVVPRYANPAQGRG